MASEIGWINANDSALVSVKLASGGGIECVIDTGFSGELFLPLSLAKVLDLQITGEQEFEVAGGSIFPAFISLIEIDWLGHTRVAEVILHEGADQLMGTALLNTARLTIDYMHPSVKIEKP
jgi:clan AA aspartic protease